MKAQHVEQLNVYRDAISLQMEVFSVSKRFPKEELFSLTDQVRRSSRSVGANLAEAWRKRDYIAHFRSKLTDADAENAETQHWIRTATLCGYLDEPSAQSLMRISCRVGSQLGRMISNASDWTT